MKVQTWPGDFKTDDLDWFLRNFKQIYHLTCMFSDGAE